MSVAETLAAMPEQYMPAGAEANKMRSRIAQALIAQASSGEPVQSWTQGLNRVLQGLVGGYGYGQAIKEGKEDEAKTAAALANLPGMGGAPTAAVPPDGMDRTITSGPRPQTASPLVEEPPAPSPYKLAGMAPPTNSQDTFRTPLDAMAPRAQGLDVLRTAMGGQPPMTGMNPAGATPVQTQPITPPAAQPTSVAAAQPTAAQPTDRIDPASAAYIQQLMKNPQTRAFGMKLYEAAIAKATPNYGFQVVGDQLVRTDPRQGRTEVVPGLSPQKPGLHKITTPKGDEVTVEGVPGSGKYRVPQIEGVPTAEGGKPETIQGPKGPVEIPPNLSAKERKVFVDNVLQNTADVRSGKLTESQSKDAIFAGRMLGSTKQLTPEIEAEGLSLGGKAASKIPGGLGSYVQNEKRQLYDSLQFQWISGALRKESGAAIQPFEWDRYERTFFPQPGEGPKVLDMKRKARALADDLMQKGVPVDIEAEVRKQLPDLPATTAKPQASTEDEKALNWAKRNPNDPRATEIKRRLGAQ